METPYVSNTCYVPVALSSNKLLKKKKKRQVPYIKEVNNLIEARAACLKQAENNNRFSSLRSVFSTAKIVQKKTAWREV